LSTNYSGWRRLSPKLLFGVLRKGKIYGFKREKKRREKDTDSAAEWLFSNVCEVAFRKERDEVLVALNGL